MSLSTPTSSSGADVLGAAIVCALVPLSHGLPSAAVVRLPDILACLDDARRLIEAADSIDDERRDAHRHYLSLARDYAHVLSALARCNARFERAPSKSRYSRDADLAAQFDRVGDAAAAVLVALDALPAA